MSIFEPYFRFICAQNSHKTSFGTIFLIRIENKRKKNDPKGFKFAKNAQKFLFFNLFVLKIHIRPLFGQFFG